MKYLYRLGKYWHVRLKRINISQLFPDHLYGSSAKAKKAALEFRAKWIKKLPLRTVGPSNNSNSGYYGICKIKNGYRAWFRASNGYYKVKLFHKDNLDAALAFRKEGVENQHLYKGPFRKTVKHGTVLMYKRYGCRCKRCIMANYKNNLAQKKARRAQLKNGIAPAHIKHGVSCYQNWGCRCAVGIQANKQAAKKWRQDHPETRE